jgi:methylmalonyl-CoA mutase C-terminal domain/subunit
MTLFPKVMQLLKKKGMTDVKVFAGGIIPEEDIPALKKVGIKEVFGPGTPTTTLIEYVRNSVSK